MACSGGNVSGRQHTLYRKLSTIMNNDRTETTKCVQKIAKIGDRANPNEKPDSKRPNIAALHCFGIISDNDDNATDVQLMRLPLTYAE